MSKNLLVDPNWAQLLSEIEIPSGTNLKTDHTAQCHLLGSLILYLGLPLGDLLTFLFNTPIADVKRFRSLEKFYFHRYRYNLPMITGPHINDLPTEILHSIFERVILPPIFIDSPTPVSVGYRTPRGHIWSKNVRMTKILSLVCKRWHAQIMPYLYEHIIIRRTDQLPQLLHTLRLSSSPSEPVNSLGNLVRGIEIVRAFRSPTIIHSSENREDEDKQLETVFNRPMGALSDVVALCPNLTSFTFTPFRFDYSKDRHYIGILSLLSITSLTLDINQCPYSGLEFILTNLAPHLLFLSITRKSGDYRRPDGDNLVSINFPKLITLHCHATETAQLISGCWTFPSLRRLTYISERILPAHTGLQCLLEKFGSGLTYLHFLSEVEDLSLIFENCPNLVRLAMPAVLLNQLPDSDVAAPSGLKWLDMHFYWMTKDNSTGMYKYEFDVLLFDGNEEFFKTLRARIPSLRRLRALTLIPHHLYRWLETFPDLDSEADVPLASELEASKKSPPDGELVIDMFDHRLRCRPRLVEYSKIKPDSDSLTSGWESGESEEGRPLLRWDDDSDGQD